MKPVTPERIMIAQGFGLCYSHPAAVACREVGLPFWAACTLLEKESGGDNVYGHDAGGALSGYPYPVTRDNFKVFEWLVFDQGKLSNGVGPTQITFKGYFTEMRAKCLRPWDVHDNMLYGFGLLAAHFANLGTWQLAATRYNGNASYGRDFVVRGNQWRARLGLKGDIK